MGAPNRKRILFVDDEPMVLEGLANLLHRQRRQWEMLFAPGGEAALAELEKRPVDVIVSDMRMPGVDGATLLYRVRERYPSITRIVLSGHAERDAVVRAIPVAHQYLAKPCDAEELRRTIERACSLQGLLDDPNIREVVGRLDKLPSVPATYSRLIDLIGERDASMEEVARIVAEDPAMTAKVLQLVNSAFFGHAQHVSSIRQAVVYLGIELFKALALTVHLFALVESSRVEGLSLSEFQRRSLVCARVARQFLSRPERAEEAFTAALLRDVGRLVLALGLPERMVEVEAEARQRQVPAAAVEREKLGVTHAEVGGYLLGIWGLPTAVVEAVAFHHGPSRASEPVREVVAAVHVADALMDVACGAPGARDLDGLVDREFLDAAGISSRLPEWEALAALELREAGLGAPREG